MNISKYWLSFFLTINFTKPFATGDEKHVSLGFRLTFLPRFTKIFNFLQK
jgi:hypothetical protein